jgi:hypothetical protein
MDVHAENSWRTTSTPSWSGIGQVARLALHQARACAGLLSRWPRDRDPPAISEASRFLVLPVAARRWVLTNNTSISSYKSRRCIIGRQASSKPHSAGCSEFPWTMDADASSAAGCPGWTDVALTHELSVKSSFLYSSRGWLRTWEFATRNMEWNCGTSLRGDLKFYYNLIKITATRHSILHTDYWEPTYFTNTYHCILNPTYYSLIVPQALLQA